MAATASRVVSKASKAKNSKWDRFMRFSGGHDRAAKSLIPDEELERLKNDATRYYSNGTRQVGVYRSPTFNAPFQERIYKDAQHLLDKGLIDTIDDAVEMAIEALTNPKSSVSETNPKVENVKLPAGTAARKRKPL